MKTSVGRNDPCPCGSGKKSKRCCGKAFKKHAACTFCGAPAGHAELCKLCGKNYATCPMHAAEASTAIKGHILRVHPETIPQIVDRIIDSPRDLAAIEIEAMHEPELWKRLFDYIAERKQQRARELITRSN